MKNKFELVKSNNSLTTEKSFAGYSIFLEAFQDYLFLHYLITLSFIILFSTLRLNALTCNNVWSKWNLTLKMKSKLKMKCKTILLFSVVTLLKTQVVADSLSLFTNWKNIFK